MGIASALIGVLPGTDSIGIAAPIMLVVLRILQGIAVGGEWSGSVAALHGVGQPEAPRPDGQLAADRRARSASSSAPVAMSLLATASGDAFKDWGWRIPFLFSLVLVGDRAVGAAARPGDAAVRRAWSSSKQVAKVPVARSSGATPRRSCSARCCAASEQMPFYIVTRSP